jgi:hypothetical protein
MNHPWTIPAKFGLNWQSSFKEKDILMIICLNINFHNQENSAKAQT